MFFPFPPSPRFLAPKTPQLQFVEGLRVLVIDFPNRNKFPWFPTLSLFVDSAADVRKVIMACGPNGEEPAIKVHVGATCLSQEVTSKLFVAGRRAPVRGGASVACLAACK